MDQPTIDGVNTFFIAKAAREAGLKAVLSGLGADEIFLGYPHFKKAELLKKIQKSPVFLKSPLKLVSLLGGKYSKLGYFINNNTPSFYLGVRGLFTPQETAKILDINLDEVEKFINNLAEFADPQTYEFKNLSAVDTLSYLELKLYLQNQLLKDTDFMSMYHSVEVRVPFLDHLLVEYLSNLPPKIKINRGANKPLLVEPVRDLLPQEIFSRSKMGFTFPFQKWMDGIYSDFRGGHWSRQWALEVLKKCKI
jgi:asparagine synthase (glutamine-hydrolysing)